ncbi:dipeptidase [Streptomyces sp. SID4919]|uniref:membrane dipeptidase n=1 Tax=unclassified Streptomyces TaxID=2593676 RepID=UPI000823C23D|nr:membrane dipeptidase [Streptomyces sp. AmelKG-E11A]MYY09122.1 dipeptidase [Streptomyces sp. SID4919]SCK29040.1 Zn-dependent dipeptidase, dipeptidase homolog [Streptomyces sp. AmelKG-E11A]
MLVDALQFVKPARERFEEWHAAGITAVHATVAIWEDSTETMREVGRWQRLLAENADLLCEGRSADDIRAAGEQGRTAVVLGFQNSSPFEDDLDLVGAFHQAGVRIAQLTYNTQNSAGAGCWEGDDAGLSRTYGVNLVREMNRFGMLIDISHCNERTSLEALETSERPVAVTHSNPRGFVGENVELAFRNKSDTVLKKAAESGGVVGLSMYPRIAPNGVDCTVAQFCDMIAYTVELIGVDHVGLGSDYYAGQGDEELHWWRQGRWSRKPMVPISGPVEFPDWFAAGRGYADVQAELLRRGFTDSEVARISGGNWLRMFESGFVAGPAN